MARKTIDRSAGDVIMTDMSTVALGNLVSVAEAAKRLGISRELVSRYVKDGRLRGSRIPGGRAYVVDAESLDEFGSLPRPAGNPNFSRKSS